NNIILNELGIVTQGVGAVGIAAQTSASQFSALDHNNYYCNVPLGANLVGKIGLIDYPSLAAWQTATGKEANSLNVEPNFVSATDLHLAATNNCSFDGAGTPVAGITTDYDDQPRDVNTPDMGADEFTATYSVTLAGITGSAVCENKIVSPAGTTFASGICDLIARVEPSGGSAVTGKINVCVTLDAATQYFNGEPYVQRHHDIEPAVSPAAATATITLYYTDQDFIDYNTNNIVWPDLPTGALGNADPNRANVRVTQFHGAATTSPSSPGNYPDTSLLITPGVPNVFWNGTFWEVTFPVTGFSGFYLHTTFTEAPLPVIVNYLNGRRQSGKHLLDWKVTCVSTTGVTITLERSVDARNYSGIYTITADAARCNQPFDYTDAQPLPGMNYYRLKMVDANGKITYSTTIALLNANKGFEIISIAPNPVTTGNFKLNITSATAVTMQVIITDMQGRTVSRQNIPVVAGFSIIPMQVGNLVAGTYTIQGIIAGERSKMIRFIKQ
ncbi:MAG: T9SS type A sorting domain-containing protein, partial [Ferruginibacter sp.]